MRGTIDGYLRYLLGTSMYLMFVSGNGTKIMRASFRDADPAFRLNQGTLHMAQTVPLT